MRSAVVLLGFLLASAQAFHIPAQTRTTGLSGNTKPSFFGRAVAQRAPAPRATLIASLEDIEKKLIDAEKAKASAAKPKAPEPKAAKAPAPAPAPTPKPAKAPVKTMAAPAPAPAPVVVAPAPAPKAVAPAPKAKSSSIGTDEVAEGVALGALPWIVAPVAAVAALRPLLAKVRKAVGGGVL